MTTYEYSNADYTFYSYCFICNKVLTTVKNKHAASGVLTKHLKEHGLSLKDYLMHYIISDYPTCACGCGEPCQLMGTKIREFNVGHKELLEFKKTENLKNEIENKKIYKKDKNILLSKNNLTIGDLFNAFELYKDPSLTFPEIAKQYGIDPRTLKSYLFKFEICSKEDFYKLSKDHKYALKYKCEKNKTNIKIDDEILEKIFIKMLSLYQEKNPVLLSKLKDEFNLNVSIGILYNRLIETYGNELINKYLTSGNSSNAENEFYYILKYFFGEKNIKRQFLLNRKIYDFLLFDKLLIEFDGLYWHSKPEHIINDKNKDEIALKNNYIIYRISDKNSNNINVLIEIQNILKEQKYEVGKN